MMMMMMVMMKLILMMVMEMKKRITGTCRRDKYLRLFLKESINNTC